MTTAKCIKNFNNKLIHTNEEYIIERIIRETIFLRSIRNPDSKTIEINEKDFCTYFTFPKLINWLCKKCGSQKFNRVTNIKITHFDIKFDNNGTILSQKSEKPSPFVSQIECVNCDMEGDKISDIAINV